MPGSWGIFLRTDGEHGLIITGRATIGGQCGRIPLVATEGWVGGGGREARQEMTAAVQPRGDVSGATWSREESYTVGSGSTGCEALETSVSEVTHWLAV